MRGGATAGRPPGTAGGATGPGGGGACTRLRSVVDIVSQGFHAQAVLTTRADPGPTPRGRAEWGSSPMVRARSAAHDGCMSSIWTVRRSTTDTKVAGLCGGVAEHWGIDPVLVRVGWALLALSGGVGAVLYLAGWLLIPLAGRTSAPLDDLLGDGTRRWPREVWVTLVVVACVAAFATFGTFAPFGVGPAVVLACIWYFGFYRSRPPRAPGTPPPASAPAQVTPFTEAADSWRRRIQEHAQQHTPQQSTSPYGTALHAPAPAPPRTVWPTIPTTATSRSATIAEPDPELAAQSAFLADPDPVGLYAEAAEPDTGSSVLPRRRGDRLAARRLRLTSLIVLGLALAGLGYADQTGVTITPAIYAATALLVVGLTLVAATWLGRARGLLPLGLLLVPVVVATSAFGPVTHLDHWSAATRSYAQVSDLPAAGDTQQAGELVVDLSQLPTTSDVDYTAHLGTGRLEVLVPPDAEVVVDYQVGVGEVRVDGQQVAAGGHLADRTAPTSATPSEDVLTLHLSVDRGQLVVRR